MTLQMTALIMGAALLAIYAPFIFAKRTVRNAADAFPRNKLMGNLLSAVAVIWTAWLIYQTPLGRFDKLKPILGVLTPVVYVLIINFMDDLLAPRSLGGIFCLLPSPIINVARWHESIWRYVILVVAYMMVIDGIILLFSPYVFRKTFGGICRDDRFMTITGVAGSSVGILLMLLGILVYPGTGS